MKKPMLMLAMLSLGTAAVAQMPAGSPPPAAPDNAMPAPPAPPMTPDAAAPPMAAPNQAMPMDPAAPSAPATPGAPDAAASMPMPPAPAAPMASTETYPVCSKTVQDKCINRSAAPKSAMHRKR